jgi:hypothetical protein
VGFLLIQPLSGTAPTQQQPCGASPGLYRMKALPADHAGSIHLFLVEY